MKKWQSPKERNIDFLEQLRSSWGDLNFTIPEVLISNIPDDQLARLALASLLELQSIVNDVTSANSVSHNYYTYVRNMDNRHRGMWGEFAALLFSQCVMHENRDHLIIDAKRFKTPIGYRRIDCFSTKTNLAVEAKASYATMRAFLLNQIEKDKYLLKEGHISSSVWLLLGDASKNLKSKLSCAGIDYFLPGDDCLKSIRSVFDLITLTDAKESEVIGEISKLFMANLSFIGSAQKAAQAGEFKH